MKTTLVLLAWSLLTSSYALAAIFPDSPRSTAGHADSLNPGPIEIRYVDSASVIQDLVILASDSMEGREAGTRGGKKARVYIARRFIESGARQINGSYIQEFKGVGIHGEMANVVGYFPGTIHANQYIVVSAHYDHLGKQGRIIYNGADDNASGVSALIGLAKYLSEHPPLHSVMVCAFDAEEEGLKGSEAFVQTPPVPLSSILFNLNLDMLSRSDNREICLSGTYHYPGLVPILNPLATKTRITLFYGHDSPEEGVFDHTTRSDHYSFHKRGIAFLKIGVLEHEDYHRPSDESEKIDKAFFLEVCNLTVETFLALDNGLTH